MYKNRAARRPPAARNRVHSDRFGRTLNRRQTRRRCTEASEASQGAVGSAAERGSAANRRLRVPEARPAISSETLALSLSATRWQERAKMTDASENTPHWTAGGLPRTVPSSLSPGAARRAVGPSRAGRPARAPARSSWHGGVRRATGRAWLAARAGGAPLPRYSSLRSAPIQQLRSAHRRAAGTPARERPAPASCWRRAAHEERDRTRPRNDHGGRHPDVPGCTE